MSQQLHYLKILPPYYRAVKNGAKTFEIRFNDRGYKVGDVLVLQEYCGGEYTGRELRREVCYIVDDPEYCKDGFVVLEIRLRRIPMHELSTYWEEKKTRPIDADKLHLGKFLDAGMSKYKNGWNDALEAAATQAPTIEAEHAADAVEVDALEAWLYELAMNNSDNYLCTACEEIISRLDGLRIFAKERRDTN